jgi:site-specific DNA-methyltransferase (adenine-specific)
MAWKLFEGDCLEIMPVEIEDNSIDMILCDLPYGTTACKWDTIIPFKPLWLEYERIIKGGAIVLTASQPFTSQLVMSNPKLFRYELIWEKTMATNFFMAKKMPQKKHENILIFYDKLPTYNPQMVEGKPYKMKGGTKRYVGVHKNKVTIKTPIQNDGFRYPSSVQKISNADYHAEHPTQKPVKLFEYLIKTYTNPGDVILDNCAGSGTTGVAAEITGRNSILIEKEPEYCEIIKKRLSEINLDQYQPQRVHKPLTSF